MKICIFVHNFLPFLGGVERYVYNLSKELIARKHKIVIVTNNTMDVETYENMDGIDIYRFDCIKLLSGRFAIPKVNKTNRKIMSEVNKNKFDFTIITPRFYIHSYIGARFAKKKKIPALVIEHGTGHFTVNNIFLDKLGALYEHIITKLVKRNVPHFAGVSNACNEWLKHFNVTAELVLYNAIDLNGISSILEKNDRSFREEYNIPPDAVVVTYTGRLIAEKGIEKLIKACLRKDYNKDIYLFIAGDGDLFEKINKIHNDRIITLGRLKFSDIIGLLKDTDIYCLPTDYAEGLPTSVLEAIACRDYVITTKAGGSKELICSPEYGIILKNNTSDAISVAIENYIDDAESSELAIENAYKKLSEEFTWVRTTDKFLNYVNQNMK